MVLIHGMLTLQDLAPCPLFSGNTISILAVLLTLKEEEKAS
jgi:hypothetical protein